MSLVAIVVHKRSALCICFRIKHTEMVALQHIFLYLKTPTIAVFANGPEFLFYNLIMQ